MIGPLQVIEKNSVALGREAQFSKKSKLARLPPVLAVQFVRFAWRKDTAKRAKILRTVSFPTVLDVRNLCTAELQASIAAHCDALEAERDAASGVQPAAAAESAPASADGAAGSSDAMDVSDDKPSATPAVSAKEDHPTPLPSPWVPDGSPLTMQARDTHVADERRGEGQDR